MISSMSNQPSEKLRSVSSGAFKYPPNTSGERTNASPLPAPSTILPSLSTSFSSATELTLPTEVSSLRSFFISSRLSVTDVMFDASVDPHESRTPALGNMPNRSSKHSSLALPAATCASLTLLRSYFSGYPDALSRWYDTGGTSAICVARYFCTCAHICSQSK